MNIAFPAHVINIPKQKKQLLEFEKRRNIVIYQQMTVAGKERQIEAPHIQLH